MSSNKGWQDLDLSRDELERVSNALRNEEFRKMFFEYCEEFQNPENRKQYEEEITQLEAERGVEVTFLNPEPGFVVKSSVDGQMKAFINISKSDKIGRPESKTMHNPETGKPGLNYSIPLAQAPPRKDLDNKGKECCVYDVLFHPEALHLSEKNSAFRKHLIDTACDAVEREFNVKLDRTNLKYPKLKFKGVARSVVLRKLSKNPPEDSEPSPIDAYYPPLPKEGEEAKPKIFNSGMFSKVDEYATPRYVIKHRKLVDMSEMTYELDAKLNLTIPKELVIEVELPLLKSTTNCSLDVSERRLFLISEKPAKYKLNIDLPFPVNDKEGSAKFDQTSRKLTIVLPVCPENERNLKDIYREDSGVESDIKEENGCVTPEHSNSLIEVLSSEGCQESDEGNQIHTYDEHTEGSSIKFLRNCVRYNFPSHFDCNTLDENLAFTLHVKNTDPHSLEFIKGEKFAHLKFSSVGSGYYPVHYAFYVSLPEDCEGYIESVDAEAWDNNVILTLSLKNLENLKIYSAGLDADDIKEFEITEKFLVASRKFSLVKEQFQISVKPSEAEVQIDIKPTKNKNLSDSKDDSEKLNNGKRSSGTKKQKKKNKKRRSLSESSFDVLKSSTELTAASSMGGNDSADIINRKVRSVSECQDNDGSDSGRKDFKGILKHSSRYARSISESYSSFEEFQGLSCSVDLPLTDSISNIPEEGSPQQQGLSESCKKTVRFSDVIRKQLFRLDSSILGQRKKNQKRKNQKQRALQRRNSEGDSSDYFDKPARSEVLMQRKNKKPSSQHDSGLDLSELDDSKENEKGSMRERIGSESSDFECKNTLMFDMEM